MHLYPYHSPVRFYKSKEALLDKTNAQNLQYFGHLNNPYPLEVSAYHRYLLPNYENEVDTEKLQLWLVGDDEVLIPSQVKVNNNRLLRISFICHSQIQGSFEIRKETGETVFYSNCVKFYNSADESDGRKYLRIATRCYFNRLGYQFADSDHDWFVTNIPAKDFGLYMVDSEYTTKAVGPAKIPEIQDSPIMEVSTIEFVGKGDCNVANFILSSLLNNELYINGTKRTIRDKPDVDELMIKGKLKLLYNKDKNGMYIQVNEDDIFSDAFVTVLGDGSKSVVYGYNFNYVIPT